jgi:DNA-binding response OmpR family regulator
MDGLELCREVRKKSRVPMMILSARQAEEDRLAGLRAGADDYMVKPFSMMEFIARVRGLLRRSEPEASAAIDAGITIGGIRIDWERHEVWVKGQLSYMTPTEFELLRLLIDADGKVLSRDDLIGRVWGTGTGDGFHTRTVDQHIAGLRRKLGIERERIVTVPNLGYKLVRD